MAKNKKNSVVAKNATTEKEEKKEWKPSGRKLEGKELEEHLSAFSDLEESFKVLYKKGK